jgi:seryl-tRNA synthetase
MNTREQAAQARKDALAAVEGAMRDRCAAARTLDTATKTLDSLRGWQGYLAQRNTTDPELESQIAAAEGDYTALANDVAALDQTLADAAASLDAAQADLEAAYTR